MFQTGDNIRFRYTGARARILADYLDGSYKVLLLQDNDEIIAFRDDIVLEKNFKGVEKSSIVKEIGEQKLKKLSTEELFYSKEELEQKKKDNLKQVNIQKISPKIIQEQFPEEQAKDYYIPVFKETAPKNSGVWLAFAQQAEDSFIIYLVNDSNFSFNFEFTLNLNGKIVQVLKQQISAFGYFALSEFEYAMLNDNPIIELNCAGFNLKEQLKLKYKKWISMQHEVPIIGINCRAQLMFNSSRMSNYKTSEKEDIKNYTKEQLKNQQKENSNHHKNQNLIQKIANFNKELDLHAEVLLDNYKSLNSAEIHERQRIALVKYMHEAVDLGVPEVYIIHGLGEGKLRNTVQTILSELKSLGKLKSFSNEYLEKYGFGATWVKI